MNNHGASALLALIAFLALAIVAGAGVYMYSHQNASIENPQQEDAIEEEQRDEERVQVGHESDSIEPLNAE